ncbi:MAG: 60S ribosomal protein L18 [Marteilia pararefringens]
MTGMIAKKTGSVFVDKLNHQLTKSRVNQRPVSLAKISNSLYKSVKNSKPQIAVICATVTAAKPSDEQNLTHNMTIAALHFTKQARGQIESRAGKCITIDEFLKNSPTGSQSMLIQGKLKSRESYRYFGAPAGAKGSTTAQRVNNKKSERARNKMYRRK